MIFFEDGRGATSQRMQAASNAGKGINEDSPLEPAEES